MIRNSKKGFTLIEALTATAVFAFVVSSIIGVYISAVQIDRKTRSQRAVIQNSRFIMEFLAKEVRNGHIYYPGYPGGVANATLSVMNQAGEIESFYLQGTDIKLEKGGVATNLNSSNVRVTKLQFNVSPAQDPFTPAKNFNVQPHVTVLLELTSNIGGNPTGQAKINVQTTLTERYYPSR